MKPLIALSIILCAAGVLAQPTDGRGPGLHRNFERIDVDGDGRLSWGEYGDRLREMFFFADLDSDGVVQRNEARRGMARRFDLLDADGDGRLLLEEFVDGHAAWFEQADRDADGGLSRAEVDQLPRSRGRRPAEEEEG